MKNLKIYISIIILMFCFSMNCYGQSSDEVEKNEEDEGEKEYITYKNALEKLMISIFQKDDINESDIVALKYLDQINNSEASMIMGLDKAYDATRDSRFLSVKDSLKKEIENGYYHTYKNAIETNISAILKKSEITPEDVVFMKELNAININFNLNKDKIKALSKLSKKSYADNIKSIIKKLENELPTPPCVSELPEKVLIIGEYIIYMPSLTTANMAAAKATMPDKGKIYYKSEFLDGKWIEMNNVTELYQLMINDPYKVIDDESVLNNIEYMAFIDKKGNLIEYRELKRYMETLKKQDIDVSEEVVKDLNEQLTDSQKAYIEDNLITMLAESKTIESKLRDIEELYEQTEDESLKKVISSLKEDIESEKGDEKRYNNAIRSLIEELTKIGQESKTSLASMLKRINGVSDEDKEISELHSQLETALNMNDKMTANTIKAILGMEFESTEGTMQNLADEFRSQGFFDLSKFTQDASFTDKEISSPKPFDDQFASLLAASVLLSENKDDEIQKITNSAVREAIEANKEKNTILLKNLMDACLNTLKNQCDKITGDKVLLSKQIKKLNQDKDKNIKLLNDIISKDEVFEDEEKQLKTAYNQVIDADKEINNLKKQLGDNDNIIDKLKKDTYDISNLLNQQNPYVENVKNTVEQISENNEDYLIDIVDLMVERYILVEEYKVEKDRGHIVSMNRIKDEISLRDYKINYILYLDILDSKEIDIEYNIRIAVLTKNEAMKATYENKKSELEKNKTEKEKASEAIMKKVEKRW